MMNSLYSTCQVDEASTSEGWEGYWFKAQKSAILALFEAMWPNFARLVAAYGYH
jgi:hypothetical protein